MSADSTPLDPESDPFSIFALPPVFDLEPAVLSRAYLSLSARLHPDIAKGDPEAARRSAAANRAKAVLQDPESRAGALLRVLGGPSKDQDRSLPSGFLQDIMETRESVDAARGSADPAELDRWRRWADERRSFYTDRVAGLFRAHAAAAPAAQAALLRQVRTELNAWRYIERLIEQLEPGYDPAVADFPEGARG
jgi:curved DNA-binding protein CbpA